MGVVGCRVLRSVALQRPSLPLGRQEKWIDCYTQNFTYSYHDGSGVTGPQEMAGNKWVVGVITLLIDVSVWNWGTKMIIFVLNLNGGTTNILTENHGILSPSWIPKNYNQGNLGMRFSSHAVKVDIGVWLYKAHGFFPEKMPKSFWEGSPSSLGRKTTHPIISFGGLTPRLAVETPILTQYDFNHRLGHKNITCFCLVSIRYYQVHEVENCWGNPLRKVVLLLIVDGPLGL